MNEDAILQAAIAWFTSRGSTLIYQTRPFSEGASASADAILHSAESRITPTPVARATAFTNSLGSLIKRNRFDRGYSGREETARFNPPESRAGVATAARHQVSDYVLALTPDYEDEVRIALDPALASLLHIRVLLFAPDSVREFSWPPANKAEQPEGGASVQEEDTPAADTT